MSKYFLKVTIINIFQNIIETISKKHFRFDIRSNNASKQAIPSKNNYFKLFSSFLALLNSYFFNMINSESKIKLQENHWNSYEAIFLQERTDFYDYKKNKKINYRTTYN